MTQTINIAANLGAGNTGLTIGYRILNMDETTATAFTTTNVTEGSTAGTYYSTVAVSAPDAGGIIVWGESGSDIVTGIIDPVPVVDLVTDAVDANALAADAVAEINATVDAAISDAALATAAALATVDNAVDAILLDTGTDGVIVASFKQNAASVAAAVEGSTLTIVRSATFDATLTGVTVPDGWTEARFTVKKRPLKTQADATSALVQILVTNGGDAGDGLVVLNSSASSLTASDASLTVNASSVDVHIEDAVTAVMATGNYEYDIKFYYGTSDSVIVATGECSVSSTPTETV